MNKRKGIAVAVVLLLVLIIGGMLAFFTDTDTESNVFTIGEDVDIEITEVWEETDGEDLHPGAVVSKEPSIENVSTVPAYVFMEVVVPCYASTGTTVDTPLFSFTPNSGWALINTSSIDQNTQTITYRYAYGTSSAMTQLDGGATTTNPLFNTVTLDSNLTAEQADTALSDLSIDINAYGIQIENLGETAPSGIFGLFSNP